MAIDEFIFHPLRDVRFLAEYAAHFYVLVNVVEEQSEVNIDSFISHNEIVARIQTNSLTANADWTYELPLAWFNSEVDDLLLQLRC